MQNIYNGWLLMKALCIIHNILNKTHSLEFITHIHKEYNIEGIYYTLWHPELENNFYLKPLMRLDFIISYIIPYSNPNIPLMEGSPTELTLDTLRFLDVYWPRYEMESQKYLQFGKHRWWKIVYFTITIPIRTNTQYLTIKLYSLVCGSVVNET